MVTDSLFSFKDRRVIFLGMVISLNSVIAALYCNLNIFFCFSKGIPPSALAAAAAAAAAAAEHPNNHHLPSSKSEQSEVH